MRVDGCSERVVNDSLRERRESPWRIGCSREYGDDIRNSGDVLVSVSSRSHGLLSGIPTPEIVPAIPRN